MDLADPEGDDFSCLLRSFWYTDAMVVEETIKKEPPDMKTGRYNAKPCKDCGRAFSVLILVDGKCPEPMPGPVRGYSVHPGYMVRDAAGGWVRWDNGSIIAYCCRQRRLGPVMGRVVASKKCDGRCEGATGHQCECACGGKNHGAAHSISDGAEVITYLENA